MYVADGGTLEAPGYAIDCQMHAQNPRFKGLEHGSINSLMSQVRFEATVAMRLQQFCRALLLLKVGEARGLTTQLKGN